MIWFCCRSVGYNNLSGPLPPSLGTLTNLAELEIGNNHFEGPVPPTYKRIKDLG